MALGLSADAADGLIVSSVKLAEQAREEFLRDNPDTHRAPLIAASIGPFGAALHDASEYTGQYGVTEEELREFHRGRLELLDGSGPDLLACETIPSADEARALAQLLNETPDRRAWFSFSCRDGEHISDGKPIMECVKELASIDRVVAVGVNCTAPAHITSLVEAILSVTNSPVVVYPNSGESWNPDLKEWSGPADPIAFSLACRGWYESGARLLGGCCRTRPNDILWLRDSLSS